MTHRMCNCRSACCRSGREAGSGRPLVRPASGGKPGQARPRPDADHVAVQTRDLHSRGQQHQEGRRDKMINNLVVKTPQHPPIMIGMMDRNEDELNAYNRKGLPDLMNAALRGTNKAYHDVAGPPRTWCCRRSASTR